MSVGFQFGRRVEFVAERAGEILREVPAAPGVFCLRGEDAGAQPYLTRAADMRRRVARLLAPPEQAEDGRVVLSKRLNLRERVRWVEWTRTGSEFESLLVLYEASAAEFGREEARRRLRLFPPYCVRLTMDHALPRLYVTNRLGRRNLQQMYGPFGSRAAAERYCEAVLDLFKLRRCWEDLVISPEHPGCVFGEMKRCMQPCNLTCTGVEYAEEARAVERFIRTRGEQMLAGIAAERDKAAEEMEFERAAALHEQYGRVKAAAGLADELVRPLDEVRAVIVQEAAPVEPAGDALEAAVFLVEGGCIVGPERMSTLGVRAVKEQTSVGSSLFAQPLMLQAVPLEGEAVSAAVSPEVRAEEVLERLRSRAESTHVSEARHGAPRDVASVGDHLALLRRWYYRPEKQRKGEVFLPNADGSWPVRRILRGAARMALGEPKVLAETNREGAAAARTKILHEGRPDVERVVPVVEKAPRVRRRKAEAAAVDAVEGGSRVTHPPEG